MADPSPDSFINEQASIGAKERDRATSGRPRFGMPDLAGSPAARDRLLGALMGFRSGMEAAQGMISQGNPVGAALMGMAGSIGPTMQATEEIPKQRQMRDLQLQMAQLEATPIEQISPAIVEKFPELAGLPAALISKIAPVLQRSESLEQQLAMFLAGERGKGSRQKEGNKASELRALESRLSGGNPTDFLVRIGANPGAVLGDLSKYREITGKTHPLVGTQFAPIMKKWVEEKKLGKKDGVYYYSLDGKFDEGSTIKFNL